jgi:hypothetical protein
MATLTSLYSRTSGKISLSVSTSFTIPAESSTQTQAFDAVAWASTGLVVHFSDNTNYGLFTITAVSGNTLTLENTWGLTNGSAIAIGGELIPAAPPGDAGSVTSATSIVFTEASAPATGTGEAALFVNTSNELVFRLESNGASKTIVLFDTYSAGDELLPSQSTHSGKFLTTNGSVASWAVVPATLPSQTGNSGKYLTTDGTNPSWATLAAGTNLLPTQSGQSGKYLTTNGTAASWGTVSTGLASQTGNSGRFLTTNGTTTSWSDLPAATVSLDTARTYTKAQRVAAVTLSDASTINVDADTGNVFYVLLGGNRTLANPTNLVNGQTLVFVLKQDGTGSRTLTYGTNYKFPGGTVPTLSTGANDVDVLYCVANNNLLYCNLVKDFA